MAKLDGKSDLFLAGICFCGQTYEEINRELSLLAYSKLRELLAIYSCKLEDLCERICKSKGIKKCQTNAIPAPKKSTTT